jgi:hypothetical protein
MLWAMEVRSGDKWEREGILPGRAIETDEIH